MDEQWHRDRIEELRYNLTNLLWKMTALLTSFLGLFSLVYLVWYNQRDSLTRGLLLIVALFLFYTFGKLLRETVSKANITALKIDRNYDILLKR